MSMNRRDVWPSREEATASFKRSKFYREWDPRVLERWIEFGVRDGGGTKGEVTLTTTKHQEVFTFLRPSWEAYDEQGKNLIRPELAPDLDPSLNGKFPTYPVYRPEGPNTVARLPNVRPSVLYIFGSQSYLSPPELRQQKLEATGAGVGGSGGAKAGRVKEVVGDYGHLIPMEDPLFCAEATAGWVKSEVERWWIGEREYEEWTRQPLSEKATISNEYKTYMGKPDKSGLRGKAKI